MMDLICVKIQFVVCHLWTPTLEEQQQKQQQQW